MKGGQTGSVLTVERIWRQEGLKIPQKQPKRGRLWLNNGSCIRLQAERKNHVWTYDFVFDRTHNGRALKMLTVVDEYSRESLAVEVGRKMTGWGSWTKKTLFIEPGSPSENGYIESFNGKLRDEHLNGEIFYTLQEAKVLVEMWRRHYNRVRLHSSLGYRPPAPEAVPGPPITNAS